MGEGEIRITYETLFELLRREKNKEELQQLDQNFIDDAKKYIEKKRSLLSNPQQHLFSAEEHEKTLLQLSNIKRILKEFYDRREKKILNIAMIKARTNALIDTSKLLEQEKGLFDSIYNSLKVNRSVTFDEFFSDDGKNSRDSAKDPAGNDLAMPEAQQKTGEKTEDAPENSVQDTFIQDKPANNRPEDIKVPVGVVIQKGAETPTRTIKFLEPSPKFVGPDLEIYGPFDVNDMVELPSKLANVLIEKGKAEQA